MPVANARLAAAQRRVRERVDPARLAWTVLVVLMAAAAAFLLHETRGTTLWFDDWNFATGRRGNSLGTFLDNYNSHFSLVPIAIYRVLFATAGIGNYVPYRILVTAGHLTCVALLFVYAKRRIGPFLALLAAALLLFLGPAWQNILWPFQIAWLISLAAGVGALLALDRRDRVGDLTACGLLLISVASSSIGVAVLAGCVVEVLWQRRRFEDTWIVAVPLVVYIAWSLGYQQTTITSENILLMPGFATTAAAGGLAALVGLGGNSLAPDGGTLMTYGAPLLVAGLVILGWRVVALGYVPVRVVTVGVMALSFWILIGLGRSIVGHGYDSRYLYVSGLLILLLVSDLAAGVVVSARIGVLLAVLTAAAVLSNLGPFRTGGAFLRVQAQATEADLGALDIARPNLAPDYVAAHFPAWPYVIVKAGSYFAAEHAIGSPAASPEQIATDPEPARLTADGELIDADKVSLVAPAGGPYRACASFQAGVANQQVQLTLPPSGLLIRASGAPAKVEVRRFSGIFQPIGTVPAGAGATLRAEPDRSSVPWHAELVTQGRTTLCGPGT